MAYGMWCKHPRIPPFAKPAKDRAPSVVERVKIGETCTGTRNHEFGKNLWATRPLHEIILHTMDIFISWSGERSRVVAEALRTWLPKIINAIKPWLSSADIDKGARWSTDVASRLEVARAGIICLTPGNLHSDWILFEAGALSKTLKNTFVCPFLIGLEPSDVKPPLAQFQATRAERVDVLQLLKTLNTALGEDALSESHIEEAFDVWWPKLDTSLKNLPQETGTAHKHRSDHDLLEEILSLVRNQSRSASVTAGLSPADFLTDDDRRQVIEGRIWKTVTTIDGSVTGSSISKSDKEIVMTMTGKKKNYTVILPIDVDFNEIVVRTLAQIKGPNTETGQPGD